MAREIFFKEPQPIVPRHLNVTHGQTDGQLALVIRAHLFQHEEKMGEIVIAKNCKEKNSLK